MEPHEKLTELDFIKLVIKHLDDTNSKEDEAKLKNALSEDEHLRSLYVRVTTQSSSLIEQLTNDSAKHSLHDIENNLHARELLSSKSNNTDNLTESAEKLYESDRGIRARVNNVKYQHVVSKYFFSRYAYSLCCAASLLIVFAFASRFLWPSGNLDNGEIWPRLMVSQVDAVDSAVWRSQKHTAGDSIYELDVIDLASGDIQISMVSGVEVMLHGPCKVSLLTPNRIKLHGGSVSANVSPWGKGFTVQTDDMEIVDLGTTFRVMHGDSGTRMSVLKGSVAAKSYASVNRNDSNVIKAGYMAQLDDNKKITVSKTDDLTPYQNLIEVKPLRSISLNNTGVGLKVGDIDRNWMQSSGPVGSEGYQSRSPVFVVSPKSSRYLINDDSGSQWIASAGHSKSEPSSTFTFYTTFTLRDINLDNTIIYANLIADNYIEGIRINGKSLECNFKKEDDRNQRFINFQTIDLDENLILGKNRLELDVKNGKDRGMNIPNPMLFRAEFQAYGRAIK